MMAADTKTARSRPWRSQAEDVLKQESEIWLAYLYGQRLDAISRFKRTDPVIAGTCLRILAAVYFVLRNLGLRGSPRIGGNGGATFFVYAGTINQGRALQSTVVALRQQGLNVAAIAKAEVVATYSNECVYTRYRFSPGDAYRAFRLMMSRGKGLLHELNTVNRIAVDWYLNEFLRVYIYLVYFLRVLQENKFECVVVANDHNVPDRCLLAVAHYLGVKTAYMQHASVSESFPALRVNYAFLDGRAALDIYKRCEGNQPKTHRRVPMPEVFLTGQKKHLEAKNKMGSLVGIASNALDDPERVIELVRAIVNSGRKVSLRWHPGDLKAAINTYRRALHCDSQVTFSDPRKEKVGVFLDGVCCLVAGNSSIHLEAALLGRQTIYFETRALGLEDYYGYVRNGLAIQARTVTQVIRYVADIAEWGARPDRDAVRYYSATYRTDWEGREGALVAEALQTLTRDGPRAKITGYVGQALLD